MGILMHTNVDLRQKQRHGKAAEHRLECRADGTQAVLAAGCKQGGWRSTLGHSTGHPRAQGEVSNEQTVPLGALPTSRTTEWYP